MMFPYGNNGGSSTILLSAYNKALMCLLFSFLPYFDQSEGQFGGSSIAGNSIQYYTTLTRNGCKYGGKVAYDVQLQYTIHKF